MSPVMLARCSANVCGASVSLHAQQTESNARAHIFWITFFYPALLFLLRQPLRTDALNCTKMVTTIEDITNQDPTQHDETLQRILIQVCDVELSVLLYCTSSRWLHTK